MPPIRTERPATSGLTVTLRLPAIQIFPPLRSRTSRTPRPLVLADPAAPRSAPTFSTTPPGGSFPRPLQPQIAPMRCPARIASTPRCEVGMAQRPRRPASAITTAPEHGRTLPPSAMRASRAAVNASPGEPVPSSSTDQLGWPAATSPSAPPLSNPFALQVNRA